MSAAPLRTEKSMKYVVCVPDGCADEPCDDLDGRTPLDVAMSNPSRPRPKTAALLRTYLDAAPPAVRAALSPATRPCPAASS